jgi:hypothetical protein
MRPSLAKRRYSDSAEKRVRRVNEGILRCQARRLTYGVDWSVAFQQGKVFLSSR